MSKTRHTIATTDELTEDGSHVIEEVDGREIAVYRLDGEYHAIANYCVHQAGPLCEGELTGKTGLAEDGWDWTYEQENEVVACPWHYWQFNVKTGVNVKDDQYRVPTYDVEVDGDDIVVVV